MWKRSQDMQLTTMWTYPLTLLLILATGGLSQALAGQVGGSEWKTDFGKHTVPLNEIVSGGPPKDGIPAIDRPKFEDVERANAWLRSNDPVVVLDVGDIVRAYPLGILIRHEIVNDVIGDRPVSITYCPLCNTALVFERRFDGIVLDFGTTGRLRHSDLVMYDRQTETWWQQATGEGIVGHYAGEQLTFVSASLVDWRSFRERYPDAQVLSRDTGYPRMRDLYGSNPYRGYDTGSPWPAFFFGKRDDRLEAMERVVAVNRENESVAVPFEVLREKRVVDFELSDEKLVAFWIPGAASAVDHEQIANGRHVGSSGVFHRTINGRTLTFDPVGDGGFRDRQTRSTWDIFGTAIAGELAGSQLPPVAHGNHFWFAWVAFKPHTRIMR